MGRLCVISREPRQCNQSDGITVPSRIGACDACDRHRHIGGRTVKRALGHRHGYFPTHCTLGLQKPGIDAKRLNLLAFV